MFLLCLIMCALFVPSAYSQEKPLGLKIMENTTFTADMGLLHFWGDMQTYPYYHVMTNKNENQFGAGLTLNYWFDNTFYVGGHYARGKLVGTKRTFRLAQTNFKESGLYFETLLSETSLRVGVNPFNLINNNPNRRFNLDLNMGHGLCYYESHLYKLDGTPYLIDKLKGRTGPTTEAVTTFGGALLFKLNHKYDIGLGTSGRFVWNDKLDAWIGEGSANDLYTFTSLSLTYHLNPNKPKPIRFVDKDEPEILPEVDSPVVAVVDPPVVDSPKVDVVDPPVDGGETDQPDKKIDTPAVVVDPVDPVKPDTPLVQVTDPETEGGGTGGNNGTTGGTSGSDDPGTNTANTTEGTGSEGGLGAGQTSETNQGVPWSEDKGYFVIVGCFKTKDNAIREAVRWKSQEKAIMNLNSKSGTWYMVAVERYATKKEALQHMNKLRNSGRSPGAWVHVKL